MYTGEFSSFFYKLGAGIFEFWQAHAIIQSDRYKIQKIPHTLPKKPHPGKDNTLKIGENCPAKSSYAAIREVPIKLRTKQCAFCGRRHAKFVCRGCHMHLCVQRPKNSRGIKYPANGPGCFFRFHGVSSFPR